MSENPETVLILDQGENFKIKLIENFECFDWGNSDWQKQLPQYLDSLSEEFRDSESFSDYSDVCKYANYLVLESLEEFGSEPTIEIVKF